MRDSEHKTNDAREYMQRLRDWLKERYETLDVNERQEIVNMCFTAGYDQGRFDERRLLKLDHEREYRKMIDNIVKTAQQMARKELKRMNP